jgi:hypothetical protein
VNTGELVLVGSITEISRAEVHLDRQEFVTLCVSGAEPLFDELRLPNTSGWKLGQRVVISIVPTGPASALPPLFNT